MGCGPLLESGHHGFRHVPDQRGEARRDAYHGGVARTIDAREILVGVEGLALLRHLYDGSDAEAARRLDEVRRLLQEPPPLSPEAMEELDARSGYDLWSGRYDEPGNPIVDLEEPAVWSLLDRRPRGRALDAACGTGRHTGHLVDLGHRVTGFDLTRAMLDRVRQRGVAARLAEGDLRAIPFTTGSFDTVVCGLALAHVGDLGQAASELGRVLDRGGRLIVSVLHPMQAFLGWQAPFSDRSGRRRFVREHTHTQADYLSAFQQAGLDLVTCREPVLTPREIQARRRIWRFIPDAALAAYQGMPAILVLELEKRSR